MTALDITLFITGLICGGAFGILTVLAADLIRQFRVQARLEANHRKETRP